MIYKFWSNIQIKLNKPIKQIGKVGCKHKKDNKKTILRLMKIYKSLGKLSINCVNITKIVSGISLILTGVGQDQTVGNIPILI